MGVRLCISISAVHFCVVYKFVIQPTYGIYHIYVCIIMRDLSPGKAKCIKKSYKDLKTDQ
jgi:hypothetical protein